MPDPTITLVQPSPEVLAARAALDAAVAALDAIAPEYPQGGVTPLWTAYTRQMHDVRMAKWDLHRVVREHYSELTGISMHERSEA